MSYLMKKYEPIKILSDGDKISFIMGDQIIVLESPLVSNMSLDTNTTLIDVTEFGMDRAMIAGPSIINVNLMLTGTRVSFKSNDNLFNEEKVKQYAQKINEEIKQLRRALEF